MADSGGADAGDGVDVGADADAPWRRGYAGPEPRPDPVAAPPSGDPVATSLPPPVPAADPWARHQGAAAVDSSDIAPGSASANDPAANDPAAPDSPPADPTAADGPSRRATAIVAAVAICAAIVAVAVVTLSRGGEGDAPPIPDQVELLWSREVERGARPVVIDDLVVVNDDAVVRAFDARTGEPRWEVPDPSGLDDLTLFTVDGVLLVAADLGDEHDDDSGLAALDPATGAERWRRPLPEDSSLRVIAGRLIEFDATAASFDGVIVDAATGDPIGDRLTVPDGFAGAPPVVGVGADAGRMHFFDLETGEVVGPTFDAEGFTTVTFVRDRLIGIRDDRLQVVDELGEVLAEIDVTLGPDQEAPVTIEASHDRDRVLVTAGDATVAIDVSDANLDIAWSMAGRMMGFDDERDRAVAVLVIDEDGPRPRVRVVDVDAGEIVHEFEADRDARFWIESFEIRRDGLLFLDEDRLRAFDADGEELWALSIASSAFAVGDVVATSGDGELTVYGTP